MTKAVQRLSTTEQGYEVTRFNALKHGVLSRYTVLPWEDESEYRVLLEALVAEHAPEGPTEEHLVEELAGIFWRKRRLRLAEAAAHQRGLADAAKPHQETVKAALVHLDAKEQIEKVVDAIQATPEGTGEEIADLEADEAMTCRAVELLNGGSADAYEKAVAALRADTQEWWADNLARDPDDLYDDDQPYTADVAGLSRFLDAEVLPWFVARRRELENRPLIRAQAFGEAVDPDRLEPLARYDVHLDRKLERTLTMLLRLQQLRREPTEL
jgi:hypothetical protein